MKSKRNNQQYNLFNKLSRDWWDENGKFKILHQIRPIRMQYILDQIEGKGVKNLEILDLGCGGGLISESLARLGGKVTGIDFAENNIEVAKIHSKDKKLKINYLYGNIENLKIKKKFDLIIMFEILEHLNNWELFLIKIDRYLKKNGMIIISTINRNLVSKYSAIYLAENILNWIPKGTHEYNKFIKPIEIENCLIKNNFIYKDLKGLIFNPISLNWELSNSTVINYFCTYKKSS